MLTYKQLKTGLSYFYAIIIIIRSNHMRIRDALK